MFRIREATPKDNAALLHLEAASPQGMGLPILIERDNYFYRSSLFERGKVLLAEEDGHLVGVMAYAVKEVFLNGGAARVAYLYDLRGEASYRRSMKRGLYRLWKAVEAEAVAEGAAFFYGHIKADNVDSLRIANKSDTHMVGAFGILVLPTLPGRLRGPLQRETDIQGNIEQIESFVGERDLRLVRLSELYTRGEGRGFLKGVYRLEEGRSFAQISVWDLSTIYRGRVLRLPTSLNLLRIGLNPLAKLLPLPRIPGVGERLTYWYLFDPIHSGKRGARLLKALIQRLRCVANAEGIDIVNLLCYFENPRVTLPHFFPAKLLRYQTVVKLIEPHLPQRPLYLDVRDV